MITVPCFYFSNRKGEGTMLILVVMVVIITVIIIIIINNIYIALTMCQELF